MDSGAYLNAVAPSQYLFSLRSFLPVNWLIPIELKTASAGFIDDWTIEQKQQSLYYYSEW